MKLNADVPCRHLRTLSGQDVSIETGILAALTPGLWFIAGIAVLAALGRTSYWMAVYYGAMSVLSYTVYAGDKQRAVSGGRRTPENILHLLDLLGGWPGGILAQQATRHKRRKSGFMAITALIVCAHLLGWTWLAVSGRTLFLTLHDRSLSQPIEQIGEDWWVR
ncbi:DUF1294 domain-containing protein [Emcibacter sp. SYSU 3D8]|uniref:DUF1294 domain-containing protein n=1 Tax=Emcibacter sp. SYSU 3D8 TaxID=3133969 RepID=UPI0031FEF18C